MAVGNSRSPAVHCHINIEGAIKTQVFSDKANKMTECEAVQNDEHLASLSHLSISEQIQELTKRLQNVNDELQQQVRDKHGSLLQQATHFGNFDLALNALAEEVQRVQIHGHRLKSQVDSQYKLIEQQTKVSGRLHELSHLLRSAGIFLTLSAKLKSTRDVLKQAEIHYELGQLTDDEDLQAIEFLQSEREYVINARQKLKSLTQMQLVNGLQERQQTAVVSALKIFMNFNTLNTCLENLVATFIANLEQCFREAFAGNDISVLNKAEASASAQQKSNSALRGPGKTPQLTTTQNFRAKFWKSLHWIIYDELYEHCEQIKLLKQCLETINQYVYTEDGDDSIQRRFWSAVQTLIRKCFSEAPPHVIQTLQEGLSKLLTSARGLEQRLGGSSDVFQFDSDLFANLESGYISKCAANMKACLAGVDLPNNETVDNFIRIAASELSSALIDRNLAKSIAAVFVSCGKDLCSNLEAQIKFGPDSKQVLDTPNIEQIQNTLLANVLCYYKNSTRRLLQDLGEQFAKSPATTVRDDIAKSLQQADLLITTILQQIMDSVLASLSIILLSMHREPGLNTEKIVISGPSMYIKELQEFLARVWAHHVDPFEDKGIIRNCGHALAQRCIDLFVHHLSIVRPLSLAGRQRLKNDCFHLEQAIKPLLCGSPISELGNSARLLRAMSLLIVQAPQDLVQHSNDQDSLIPSYIILFLLFGHAGPELQSPHATLNWSNERLIEWLEGHTSEREKLELISGALQRYRDTVRRKKSEQYDELYPKLVEFFEKALQATQN